MRGLLLSMCAFISFAFSQPICIKEVQNPYGEPYVSYAFRKVVERALLEDGYTIGCYDGSKEVRLRVEALKDMPIAYTPQQRVSAYNLELKVSLSIDEKSRSFHVVVPYTQASGALGDLPRRQAVDEAFKIIYVDMLEFLRR